MRTLQNLFMICVVLGVAAFSGWNRGPYQAFVVPVCAVTLDHDLPNWSKGTIDPVTNRVGDILMPTLRCPSGYRWVTYPVSY